jgi:hypothetical protein
VVGCCALGGGAPASAGTGSSRGCRTDGVGHIWWLKRGGFEGRCASKEWARSSNDLAR